MRKRLYSLLDGDGGAAMWCGRVMTVLIIASLLPLCFKESSPVLETIEYACVLVWKDGLSTGDSTTSASEEMDLPPSWAKLPLMTA